MKVSIYNIQQEYLELISKIIENDGVLDEETELALTINKDQLQSKSESYAYVIKEMDAECDIIDLEIKRLQQCKKVRENAIERLKATLTNAMHLFEVPEIKTPLIKINFRKSESVIVMDVNDLPAEYKVVKVTEQADKVKIKDALKKGEQILGCELVINQNIQIK
jgi:hypothetical protein